MTDEFILFFIIFILTDNFVLRGAFFEIFEKFYQTNESV